MHSDSDEAIRDIRSNKALFSIGEACTKAGVVLRLVSALGWNLFNVEEVRPEYTVGSRRLDYSLRIANMNKVFIEVKRVVFLFQYNILVSICATKQTKINL
jgi:predicted type IV restriction endonuclease